MVRPPLRQWRVFAALLGSPDNGRWLIAPASEVRRLSRQYRDDTLILETEFETDTGVVGLTDLMPVPSTEDEVDIVRIVRGIRGEVPMRMEAIFRNSTTATSALGAATAIRPPCNRRP